MPVQILPPHSAKISISGGELNGERVDSSKNFVVFPISSVISPFGAGPSFLVSIFFESGYLVYPRLIN
ncbi:uncharacterized protein BT62DRAFT_1012473 [Guyanagaster necrorhizus]|uniref:Uncharacterized protein n=1 Tax=Guyanagaster necrorhizus TaxID=856835 RepID=A0A9P7VGQ9_9AGAR|nr:uncharacterized protein BT62DRAFT_1012473 [Guyanagaster necrorhizus MCA 3950]KAG7440698.1 hypothetical protein BT62DRAFT_1012473 [Guyanagaster necrorhizus MCA 3950]